MLDRVNGEEIARCIILDAHIWRVFHALDVHVAARLNKIQILLRVHRLLLGWLKVKRIFRPIVLVEIVDWQIVIKTVIVE